MNNHQNIIFRQISDSFKDSLRITKANLKRVANLAKSNILLTTHNHTEVL